MNVAANLLMERFQSRDSRNCIENGIRKIQVKIFHPHFKKRDGRDIQPNIESIKRSANRSLFFQKFFNIVSGLILFNLAIAAAHFIERNVCQCEVKI